MNAIKKIFGLLCTVLIFTSCGGNEEPEVSTEEVVEANDAAYETQEYVSIKKITDANNKKLKNEESYLLAQPKIQIIMEADSNSVNKFVLLGLFNENKENLDTSFVTFDEEGKAYYQMEVPADETVYLQITTEVDYQTLEDGKFNIKSSETVTEAQFIFAFKYDSALAEEAASPEGRVKAAANNAFTGEIETQVVVLPDENGEEKITRINVFYKPEVIISEKSELRDVQFRTTLFLQRLREAGLDYESVFVTCIVDTVDVYGNEGQAPFVKLEVSKETADKINFENFDSNKLRDIADYFQLYGNEG